jgi:hypothetical protein
MNSQDLSNLQEAYLEVYQLDEELTGPRRERALQILKNAKPPITQKEMQLSDIISGVEGSESNFKMRKTRAMPTKRGGGGIRGERKTGRGSAWNSDRGSGNKAAKRASKANESYDLYDIILSHLLDEGYADTQEQAEVIMVNMSEDWRESIVEEVLDEKIATPPSWWNARRGLDAATRRRRRSRDFDTYGGENQEDLYGKERTISTSKGEGGITKNPKKLRKQKAMGEHG